MNRPRIPCQTACSDKDLRAGNIAISQSGRPNVAGGEHGEIQIVLLANCNRE